MAVSLWPGLPPLKLSKDVEDVLLGTYVRGKGDRGEEDKGDGKEEKVENNEGEQKKNEGEKEEEEGEKKEEGEAASRRLRAALLRLGQPPLYTTLRINCLAPSAPAIPTLLQQQLDLQCELRQQEKFRVFPHPALPDLLCVENRAFPHLLPEAREVIVDQACGMAVLRGADVFAPGIMGAPSGLREGQMVAVYADIEGKCRKGLTQRYHGNKVFVGNGLAQISRDDLFCCQPPPSGVGVLMTQPLCQAPRLAGLLSHLVFAQNLPSALASHVLCPLPHLAILDMCASPGGKTTHIATLMKNEGLVVALDKTEDKVSKVRQAADLWGLTCVHTFACDSRHCVQPRADTEARRDPRQGPPFAPETFDRVLLDAPCSALGQRPSSANSIALSQLASYRHLQRALFDSAVQLLRPGGVLVYSTCTLTLEENEELVAWALSRHTCLQLSPQEPRLGGPGLRVAALTDQDALMLQRFDPSRDLSSSGLDPSFVLPSPGPDPSCDLPSPGLDPNCDLSCPGPDPNCDLSCSGPESDCIGFFLAKFVKR